MRNHPQKAIKHMNYATRKQMLDQAFAFSQSSAELNRKIDSWTRLLAENQRVNELEFTRLQQKKTEQISEVPKGTVIASGENSGKWFAGGTQMPDQAAMLDPNNLAEMLRELDTVFKKR